MDYGKHTFLKNETACPLNSHAIDRIVTRGLKQEIRNEISIKPFLPMVNFESEIFCPNVDVTRAQVAFGDRAIPKIKRELLSKDTLLAKRAVNSLLDLVHDPEIAVEAIRLQVIPRLVRLMSSDDAFTRQHVLMTLEVLAMQPYGKMAIVTHETIMSNLSVLMLDSDRNVRLSAVKLLLALATRFLGVEELIKDYYVYLITNQLEHELDNDIVAVLIQSLILLLDQSDEAKAQALDNKAIELSVYLGHPEARLRALSAELISQLARHPEGRETIFQHKADILSSLSVLLDDKDVEVQTRAAEALMFLLVERLIRNHCLTKLPVMCVLIRCAQYFRSSGLQVNAMKGLTCLAEHPAGREFLVGRVNDIEAIRVANLQVQNHKTILLSVINTVI